MINPILTFSARRRMRSPRTAGIIFAYCAVLLAFLYMQSMHVFSQPTITIAHMRWSVEGYIYLLALEFFLIVLVAPAMTAGAIAGERERQTLDLMLVTDTPAWRIAFGKLLESFAFLALLVVVSLPILAIVLVTGGVTIGQIALSAAYLIVSAFAVLSLGLLCSALIKRSVTATVTAYLVLMGIGLVTMIPMLLRVNIYADAPDFARMTQREVIDYLPVSFLCNPVLGLLALMADQTDLLRNTMSSNLGYYLAEVYPYVNFRALALINMGVMAAAGLVLTGASALLIRPRGRAHSAAVRKTARGQIQRGGERA